MFSLSSWLSCVMYLDSSRGQKAPSCWEAEESEADAGDGETINDALSLPSAAARCLASTARRRSDMVFGDVEKLKQGGGGPVRQQADRKQRGQKSVLFSSSLPKKMKKKKEKKSEEKKKKQSNDPQTTIEIEHSFSSFFFLPFDSTPFFALSRLLFFRCTRSLAEPPPAFLKREQKKEQEKKTLQKKKKKKMTSSQPTPMTVSFAKRDVDDLRARLRSTRWPTEVEGTGWDHGAPLPWVRSLAETWASDFDFKRAEERLNEFPNFVARVGATLPARKTKKKNEKNNSTSSSSSSTQQKERPTSLSPIDVHFIHARANRDRPAAPPPLPLLLLHGWPGSVVEFLAVIGPLTDPGPESPTAQAFDVVAPSLPGKE